MVCMWEKVGSCENNLLALRNGMVRKKAELHPRIVRLWEWDGAGDLSFTRSNLGRPHV